MKTSIYNVIITPTKAWGNGSIKMSDLTQHHLYHMLSSQFGLSTETSDRAVYDAARNEYAEISSAWLVIKIRLLEDK
jgi:hypothetical protein